jgi:tellurite resistance protein
MDDTVHPVGDPISGHPTDTGLAALGHHLDQARGALAAVAGDVSLCAVSRSGQPFPAAKYHEGAVSALTALHRESKRSSTPGGPTVDLQAAARRHEEEWLADLPAAQQHNADWTAYRAGGLEALQGLIADLAAAPDKLPAPEPTVEPPPTPPETPTGRLAHFPVTFFGTAMGTAGLALAWQRSAPALGVPPEIGDGLFWVSLGVYAAVLGGYLAKLVRHPREVRAELHHPVRLAFVPMSATALLLLATAGQDVAPALSATLWWIAAPVQLLMTLYVLSAWIDRPGFSQLHLTPAWFIPVVGLAVVPLAGVRHGPAEVSWFFFAVALVFWLALLPIVLNRLFVGDQPVPAKLLPTQAVLVAPPAILFLAYLRLVPDDMGTARILYYVALFFAMLVATQVIRLHRIPFLLSWWAYSFPAAALAVATSVVAGALGGVVLTGLAWVVLVLTSALVGVLTARTLVEMARNQVCVPE